MILIVQTQKSQILELHVPSSENF